MAITIELPMKTNPKSKRGPDGRFVKTGYNEKEWKRDWYQRNSDSLKKRNRDKYLKNKEHILKKQREYSKRPDVVARRRSSCLMTSNGQLRGLSKREYTGYCELCGEEVKRLNYHHWDGSKPFIGIWLCGRCHWFVEGVDDGLQVTKYIEMKCRLEKEYL